MRLAILLTATTILVATANADPSLYLVRLATPLPDLPGLTIQSQRGSAALVTADEPAVARLRDLGALVVPLNPNRFAARSTTALAPVPATRNPRIQGLVDGVSWEGLSAKIGWLQDFGTRYSYSPMINTAADSLRASFQALGLTAEFHNFHIQTTTLHNVVATQLGTVEPDSIVVICAHYDCTSEQPYAFAPGADDNASGTAAVLTAAELLADVPCRYTIKYICFAGEEQGLRGSDAWVRWADQQNLAIIGALNFDMIGWWTPGTDFDLEIETNNASIWLADIVLAAADLYTDMPYELHVDDGAWWGDHASFWDYGYAAVNHEEAWDWYDPDFNPYYHSTQDLLAYIDPAYAVGNTRIGVASLASLARPTDGVAVADTPAAAGAVLAGYPNPFNGRLTVSVSADPSLARIGVTAYDLRGRRLAVLDVPLAGGRGQAAWDARDAAGRALPAGAYLLRCDGAAAGSALKVLYAR